MAQGKKFVRNRTWELQRVTSMKRSNLDLCHTILFLHSLALIWLRPLLHSAVTMPSEFLQGKWGAGISLLIIFLQLISVDMTFALGFQRSNRLKPSCFFCVLRWLRGIFFFSNAKKNIHYLLLKQPLHLPSTFKPSRNLLTFCCDRARFGSTFWKTFGALGLGWMKIPPAIKSLLQQPLHLDFRTFLLFFFWCFAATAQRLGLLSETKKIRKTYL